MLDIQIRSLFPRFLLKDRDGYAMIRAIEAAMEYLDARASEGIGNVSDPAQMPEWRLDEMAWELMCPYDYSAPIEAKRRWIEQAVPYYSILGTKAAIRAYLDGNFGYVHVEENWEYGADPYHFRVLVGEAKENASYAWALQAILQAQNVRSVLDGFAEGGEDVIGISDTAEFYDMGLPRASGQLYAQSGHLTDDLY